MIVFTRKYPLQRMLKKRNFKQNKLPTLRFGTIGLYCLYTFRFEYRYCLFFRKFFKKMIRRKKRKIRTYYRRRIWLYIRPNYTLTHKSKNARMGKGKGNFKRWCTIVYAGRIFIEHSNVSVRNYVKYMMKMRNKMKLEFKYVHKSFYGTKQSQLSNCVANATNALNPIRVRKTLYLTYKQLAKWV